MNNNLKPDIDFEKELWAAANELRGAVAENQYKDYVLSLIFLKHLSERYEMRRQELENLVQDPDSDYNLTSESKDPYLIVHNGQVRCKRSRFLSLQLTYPLKQFINYNAKSHCRYIAQDA